jgi:NitT/TauT family transport system substrate-binding protein
MPRMKISGFAVPTGFLASIAAMGVAACSGQPAAEVPTAVVAPSATQAPIAVRVGSGGALAEAGQRLAAAQGYFAEEGLAIDFVKVDPASALVPLMAGQIDVAGDGLGAAFFNAIQQSVDIHIVAPLGSSEPNANGVFLVVRKDLVDSGRVREYADLKGLKIAIPAHGNSAEYGLARAMQLGGLTLADSNIVELNFQNVLAALTSKAIDVGTLPEPLATAAVQNGSGVKWKGSGDYLTPGSQGTVVAFSSQFAARRDIATRWMTAYIRGVRDYNDAFFKNLHRPQTVETLAGAFSLNSKLFDEMSFTRIDPNGKVNVPSMEELMRWYVQMGYVSTPVDLSRVVDTSFADAAVARLGPYQ